MCTRAQCAAAVWCIQEHAREQQEAHVPVVGVGEGAELVPVEVLEAGLRRLEHHERLDAGADVHLDGPAHLLCHHAAGVMVLHMVVAVRGWLDTPNKPGPVEPSLHSTHWV